MSYIIKSTAEFRQDDDGPEPGTNRAAPLTASRELCAFLQDLPAEAVLTPLTVDQGNQRDPWHVLVGLRASWEEQR